MVPRPAPPRLASLDDGRCSGRRAQPTFAASRCDGMRVKGQLSIEARSATTNPLADAVGTRERSTARSCGGTSETSRIASGPRLVSRRAMVAHSPGQRGDRASPLPWAAKLEAFSSQSRKRSEWNRSRSRHGRRSWSVPSRSIRTHSRSANRRRLLSRNSRALVLRRRERTDRAAPPVRTPSACRAPAPAAGATRGARAGRAARRRRTTSPPPSGAGC